MAIFVQTKKPNTMNCMPYISSALLLLALTAGTFLLAKTKKDGLGLFYKIVSWTVIIVASLALLCCLGRCICKMRCGGWERHCETGMQNCMHGGGCGMMGGGNCMMQGGCGMMGGGQMHGGGCGMMMQGGCCGMCGGGGMMECHKMKGHCEMDDDDDDECCEGKGEKCEKKIEIKKDTVIKKK